MARPTIHMIGNAHIDPVWLWPWQDGLEVAVSTCRDAVRLLQSHPRFIFSRSSAAVYHWIELVDPDLFEKIRDYVRKGRWNIVGGWWVQPDCNIPCGESFVRQGLYGQLYFEERFGLRASVGFNVDSFGHNGSLPQILKKSGLKYYVFHRPGVREKHLPSDLFKWESKDGSQVLAARLYSYGAGDVEDLERKFEVALSQALSTGMDWICFYGRGDHGGGPTEDQLRRIDELSSQTKEATVKFSTPEEFFERVSIHADKLPVVRDDLQHHARGCYTVLSEMKRWNRRLEVALMNAEKFCSAAHLLTGMPYPRTDLRQCWQTLLFHQFHDILGGTSIKEAYDAIWPLLSTTMGQANSHRDLALEAISLRVKTDEREGVPVLVYNPSGWERREPIEVELNLDSRAEIFATDEEGNRYPVQIIESRTVQERRRMRGVFVAPLPAFGYRVFWITAGEGELQNVSDLETTANSMENSHLKVSLDPETLRVNSILSKREGVEILAGPIRALVIDDQSDTWSHGVDSFRDEVGEFEPDGEPVLRPGVVRSTMSTSFRYGRSKLTLTYVLHSSDPLLRCLVEVDWHEKHKMLKMSLPLAIDSPKALYEIPYGVISRPTDGEEHPGQRWVDLRGTLRGGREAGLLLLNDSKYGFDALDSDLRISLLRSPIYAFHAPRKPRRRGGYLYTDQGRHTIRLGLLPHIGLNLSDAFSLAEAFNNPPIIAFSNRHPGSLPPSSSFVAVRPGNVCLAALKISERGDFPILRLFECEGLDTQAAVSLPLLDQHFEVQMNPWEIKTLGIRRGKALEMNMLEEPV